MNKEYIIWVSTPGNVDTRVVKKEEELTEQDCKLFLGNLITAWNNTPVKTRLEFMTHIINTL